MPIMGAQPIIQNNLNSIFNQGLIAKPNMFSIQFTSILASCVPMGLFPAGFFMIPLPPVGFGACNSMINLALSGGSSSNVSNTAKIMATGVSLLVPLVPPSGLSNLTKSFENAFSLGITAQTQTVSMLMAMGIVNYYLSGGVV